MLIVVPSAEIRQQQTLLLRFKEQLPSLSNPSGSVPVLLVLLMWILSDLHVSKGNKGYKRSKVM